jgi:hypothetical protein
LGFFYFFNGFPTQFPNIISKAPTLCSTKVLNQEDSKFVDPVLQSAKNTLSFTSNVIILQYLKSTFLNFFFVD